MRKNYGKIFALCLTAAMTMTANGADLSSNIAPGVVTGRVVDADRQSLPGASVTIEGLNTGVVSDINGYYTFPNLKPGTYMVRVSYVGYRPQVIKLVVTGDKPKVQDFVLKDGAELAGVEVVGAFHGQRKALQMQKERMGVTNVVSADQVGKFPDSNIGDALKRINGVNVQYDQGEARFGQVRGTSADLTSVTVNGNRVPSAEGGTRNAQLDLIPADMVQTIELNKVVTSDMDGDAIGGEINLVTKNTPDRRTLNFSAGSGYTWISGKPQWDLAGTWGDRFFGGKLGVMAAASYQYAPGGSDNTEFEYEEKDGKIELKEAQIRQYYVTRERQSYSLAADLNINPVNKISFKGLYNRRSDWENRYRIQYKKLNSKASKQSVVMQTKAGADGNKDARLELQQTLDLGLDGEHYIGAAKVDWGVNYSRASEDRPDERYASYRMEGEDYGAAFDGTGTRQPYSAKPLPGLDDERWQLYELTNQDENIVEKELKAKLNLTLPIATGLYGNKLRLGTKITSKKKTKDVSFFDYDADKTLGADWREGTTTAIRDGFMPGGMYPARSPFISKETIGRIDFSRIDGTENYEEEAGNYDIREDIWAGYLRFDQKLGRRLSATVGLRVEHTDLKTSGYNLNPDLNEGRLTPTGVARNAYTDFLPSLLLKYGIGKDGNLRASVTRTIARPKYSALIANKAFNLSDLEATIGDPDTKPARAWNADLSVDYYFKSVGMVSLGVFYKDISNVNIEWASNKYLGSDLGLGGQYANESFAVTQNINAYDARVFGIEAAYQRDFGFIAPALKCVGFYGNYTYTHSSTRNFNPILNVADGDDIKVAGSPEHTANASLYFDKAGFNLRLSYNFASEFIDEMSVSRALDRYYDKVNYLDLNASYTWGRDTKFIIFADATNLLNQPLRYYQGDKDRTMQVEYYGVKLKGGLKIRF